MTADGTVEWGADRPTGWLDRLLGVPDRTGRRRISGPALGSATIAAALLLASELTPWMAGTVASSGPLYSTGDNRDYFLEDVAFFSIVGHHLGWLVLLVLIGLALTTNDRIRPMVVAAGLGCCVALLTMVIGLTRQIGDGGSVLSGDPVRGASLGPGAYFGLAAVVIAAVALVLSGWQPGVRAGHRSVQAVAGPEVDEGPADLTVTPIQ